MRRTDVTCFRLSLQRRHINNTLERVCFLIDSVLSTTRRRTDTTVLVTAAFSWVLFIATRHLVSWQATKIANPTSLVRALWLMPYWTSKQWNQ